MSSSTDHGVEKHELDKIASAKSSSSFDKDLSLSGQTPTDGSIAKVDSTPAVPDEVAARWLTGRKLVIVHSAMLLAFVPDRQHPTLDHF